MDENKYYNPFEIIKLERISDIITHIGKNYVVRINVSLSKSVNDNKYLFYTEYEYDINGHKGVSIKRGYDYYISIESITKNSNGNKLFIRIGLAEYYVFVSALEEVITWFIDKKWSRAFAKKDGKIIMTSDRPNPKSVRGLPMNKSITFDLIVLEGYISQPGVRIIFDDDFYADVSADVIFSLYSAFSNFNMFMSAQTMLASLGIPLGVNRINLNNPSTSNPLPSNSEEVPKVSSIEGRKIGGKSTLEDLEK